MSSCMKHRSCHSRRCMGISLSLILLLHSSFWFISFQFSSSHPSLQSSFQSEFDFFSFALFFVFARHLLNVLTSLLVAELTQLMLTIRNEFQVWEMWNWWWRIERRGHHLPSSFFLSLLLHFILINFSLLFSKPLSILIEKEISKRGMALTPCPFSPSQQRLASFILVFVHSFFLSFISSLSSLISFPSSHFRFSVASHQIQEWLQSSKWQRRHEKEEMNWKWRERKELQCVSSSFSSS